MTSITTRAGKGTPLTHTEVDDNFSNLNADKLEASNNLSDVSSASAARTNLGLGTAATTASTDYATSAQGALADSALQSGDNVSALTNDAGYTTNVGDITGVTAGSGISGGGTSGTVTVSHADTSSQGSVNNSGTTVIQDITLDTYGHITALGSTTLSIPAAYTNSDVDTHLNTGTAASGEFLSWNGSDYDWAAAGGGFPSGTKMLFQQTAAPTGWTKDTTHDNKALRVVSGTAGSGGTSSFTTIFADRTSGSTSAGGTVGATTLTVSQMPSHRHITPYISSNSFSNSANSGIRLTNREATTSGTEGDEYNRYSEYEGGGGSHNHSFSGTSHSHTLDMRVQYVDLIIATKD